MEKTKQTKYTYFLAKHVLWQGKDNERKKRIQWTTKYLKGENCIYDREPSFINFQAPLSNQELFRHDTRGEWTT
jgi:hypothetical protein